MKKIAFLSILLLSGIASQAMADGVLNALSMRPFDAKAPIFVRTMDDANDSIALRDQFQANLDTIGYKVSDDADLVVTITIQKTLSGISPQQKSGLISLQASGGRGGGENASAMLNLFDSAKGGALNKGQTNQIATSSTGTIRLDVTIDSLKEKHRLWQGWVNAPIEDENNLTPYVKALAENLGQRAKQVAVPQY